MARTCFDYCGCGPSGSLTIFLERMVQRSFVMKVIETADAPNPVGPYSQAIDAGDFVFLSGQIPIDPKTNEVCLYNGDVVKQAERVLENIRAVLKAVGLSPAKVVKTAIFMTDL